MSTSTANRPHSSGSSAAQAMQALADAYVEGYELRDAEDANGNTGDYPPNEREQMLIQDAVNGLIADDDFLTAAGLSYLERQRQRRTEGRCLGCGAPAGQHWGNRPECSAQASTNDRLETLERIAELASELCNAVDCESEDVGGTRPALVILREIGPLTDRLAKCSTAALPARAEAVPPETNATPPVGLLVSMAIRLDHGLGCPGYYDSPAFSASGLTHKRRLEAAMSTARQLLEEVTGQGFYSREKEQQYARLAQDLPATGTV